MGVWSERFTGGPSAAREARHAVREHLGDTLPPAQLDDVELLVSELATNCIRHGSSDGAAELAMDARVSDDCVRVRLCDQGAGFEPGTPAPRPDGEGGWGLVLVDRLSDRWGTARDGAFCVWFEVMRSPDHSLVR